MQFLHFLKKPPTANLFVNWFRKCLPRRFQRCKNRQWCILFHLNFLLHHCDFYQTPAPKWSRFMFKKVTHIEHNCFTRHQSDTVVSWILLKTLSLTLVHGHKSSFLCCARRRADYLQTSQPSLWYVHAQELTIWHCSRPTWGKMVPARWLALALQIAHKRLRQKTERKNQQIRGLALHILHIKEGKQRQNRPGEGWCRRASLLLHCRSRTRHNMKEVNRNQKKTRENKVNRGREKRTKTLGKRYEGLHLALQIPHTNQKKQRQRERTEK